MLFVHKYQKTKEVYELSFLKENYDSVIFLTPSPAVADSIREGLDGKTDADVLTINFFVNEGLNTHLSELEKSKIKKKSEVYLLLGAIWKKYFPKRPFCAFEYHYNLFTELRSFGTRLEDLSEVIEDFSEETKKTLIYFWSTLDNLEIIDEQKSYSILAKKVQESPLDEKKRAYVFYGFKFLNSIQIDLLKALSNFSDVYVPLPDILWERSRISDWINWLDADQKIEQKVSSSISKNLKISIIESNDIDRFIVTNAKDMPEIISLDSQEIDLSFIQSLGSISTSFKVSCDPFFSTLKVLEREIRGLRNRYSEITLTELKEWTRDKVCNTQDYKYKKVLIEYYKTLNLLGEQSEDEFEIDKFYFELIFSIAKLNAPRLFYTDITSGKKIKTINGGWFQMTTTDNALYVLKEASSRSAQEDGPFSSFQLKKMASIGPMFSKMLSRRFDEFKLNEIIEDASGILAINKQVFEESQSLSEKLADHSDYYQDQSNEIIRRTGFQSLYENEVHSLSASSIQNFMDCQYKFYVENLARIAPDVSVDHIAEARELGELEHKVIEEYFKTENDLPKVIELCFEEYTSAKKKNFDIIEMAKAKKEVLEWSKNAIDFFESEIKEDIGKLQFEDSFVEKVDSIDLRGRADCIMSWKSSELIIDFKRSEYSIPTKKDVLTFKKIQCLFYVKRYFPKLNIMGLGYFCLKNPENSLFVLNENNKDANAMSVLLKKKNIPYTLVDFEQLLIEYSKVETETIGKIKSSKSFRPNPVDNSVCSFCSIRNVCAR